MRRWWAKAKLWVLLAAGALITAAQFVFWRLATKKPKPTKIQRIVEEKIAQAELDAAAEKALADRDDEEAVRSLKEAASLPTREERLEALAELLKQR